MAARLAKGRGWWNLRFSAFHATVAGGGAVAKAEVG